VLSGSFPNLDRGTPLGTRGEGIKKGFRYVGKSKDRALYVSIVVVDNIVS
jgi:hypothetical protein